MGNTGWSILDTITRIVSSTVHTTDHTEPLVSLWRCRKQVAGVIPRIAGFSSAKSRISLRSIIVTMIIANMIIANMIIATTIIATTIIVTTIIANMNIFTMVIATTIVTIGSDDHGGNDNFIATMTTITQF